MDGCHSSLQGADGAMSYSGHGTFHPHWGQSQEEDGGWGRVAQSKEDLSGRCASNEEHILSEPLQRKEMFNRVCSRDKARVRDGKCNK